MVAKPATRLVSWPPPSRRRSSSGAMMAGWWPTTAAATISPILSPLSQLTNEPGRTATFLTSQKKSKLQVPPSRPTP